MAKSEECKLQFIKLRAKGFSYTEISKKLNISKPVQVKWNKQFEELIESSKVLECETLLHEYRQTVFDRFRTKCQIINKLDEEILKRNFSDIPTEKLLSIRTNYIEQLVKETPRREVRYLPVDIPDDLEFFESPESVQNNPGSIPSNIDSTSTQSHLNPASFSDNEKGDLLQENEQVSEVDESGKTALPEERLDYKPKTEEIQTDTRKAQIIRDFERYESELLKSSTMMNDNLLNQKDLEKILFNTFFSPQSTIPSLPAGSAPVNSGEYQVHGVTKACIQDMLGHLGESILNPQASNSPKNNKSFLNSLPRERYDVLSEVCTKLFSNPDPDNLTPKEMNVLTSFLETFFEKPSIEKGKAINDAALTKEDLMINSDNTKLSELVAT